MGASSNACSPRWMSGGMCDDTVCDTTTYTQRSRRISSAAARGRGAGWGLAVAGEDVPPRRLTQRIRVARSPHLMRRRITPCGVIPHHRVSRACASHPFAVSTPRPQTVGAPRLLGSRSPTRRRAEAARPRRTTSAAPGRARFRDRSPRGGRWRCGRSRQMRGARGRAPPE